MNTAELLKLYDEFVIPSYKRLPICLVKGKGSRVWDLDGREYIDFFPGWAVSGLGHCHPKVVSALKEQSKKILHISNNFLSIKQAELARELSKAAFPARVFFPNSGAEAIEGVIKFMRRWGSTKGKHEIITMKGSFHGRTFGAMTATGQERIHGGFGPLPAGFKYAELNNLDSVKALVTPQTAGVILEPVQGEGGIHIASQEFMQGLRKLADEKGFLLAVDEVQTGIAKTGKMFAYQNYGIEPDLMALAKSLGGGLPVGALLIHKKIKEEVFTPGVHGSTYGGNPLVAAAALAVLKVVKEENLIPYALEISDLIRGKFEAFKKKFSFVKEVRIMGVMAGLELAIPGQAIVDDCLANGLLINCTQERVLRIIPASNIPKKLLKKGLHILEKALEKVKV